MIRTGVRVTCKIFWVKRPIFSGIFEDSGVVLEVFIENQVDPLTLHVVTRLRSAWEKCWCTIKRTNGTLSQ